MMLRRVLTAGILLATALALATVAVPRGEPDTFNLGALGAEGFPVGRQEGKSLNLPKDTLGVRVLNVPDGTPAADAGLKVEDIIVGTARGMFLKKRDPIYTLIEHLEGASGQKNGTLKLMILREGKNTALDVKLPFLGKHSKTCPVGCERCDRITAESLAWLAGIQGEDGSFEAGTGGVNGKVVVTTWCGLAFLASGSTPNSGAYADNIKRAGVYVMENCGREEMWPGMGGGGGGDGGSGGGGEDGGGTGPASGGGGGGMLPGGRVRGNNWNQTNWPLSIAPWLLCELALKEKTPELMAKLEEIGERLLANQERTGGWAHGPGGPNALGYVELEIMSNYALASLGMMRRLEIELPQGPIDKALAYVEATSAGDGGVGYSTQPGQQGNGDPGRTAGAIVAFSRLGKKAHPFFKKMGSFLKSHMEDLPNGHVSPVMHFLASAFACQELAPEYWSQFMELFHLEIMAARRPDGSFTARPTEESQQLHSNTDRDMGPAWTTGSYLLILQLKKGNLQTVTGK